MKSFSIGPRRIVVPQKEAGLASSVGVSRGSVPASHRAQDSIMHSKSTAKEGQEDDTITPPSISGTVFDDSRNPFDAPRDQAKPGTGCQDNELKHPNDDGQKRVQFSVPGKVISQGNIYVYILVRILCTIHELSRYFLYICSFFLSTCRGR